MTTTYHFTVKSSNRKTGPIPTTTTADQTCPPSCPMFQTCYAKSGPQALHWNKISKGERGGSLEQLCDSIASLPENQVWRHNVSGDLPGLGEHIDIDALEQIVAANAGRQGYTYTHKRPSVNGNAEAIQLANDSGFTVNLSSNSLQEADEYADLGIAPVVTILPSDCAANTTTPAGRKVIVCPATQRDNVTCETCRLCARRDRSVIVGFPAHGSRKRLADQELAAR